MIYPKKEELFLSGLCCFKLREACLSGRRALVVSRSLDTILWLNAQAASYFGYESLWQALGTALDRKSEAYKAFAALLKKQEEHANRPSYNVDAQNFYEEERFALSLLPFADEKEAILIEERGSPCALVEASSLVSSLEAPDVAAAIVTHSGVILARSAGFNVPLDFFQYQAQNTRLGQLGQFFLKQGSKEFRFSFCEIEGFLRQFLVLSVLVDSDSTQVEKNISFMQGNVEEKNKGAGSLYGVYENKGSLSSQEREVLQEIAHSLRSDYSADASDAAASCAASRSYSPSEKVEDPSSPAEKRIDVEEAFRALASLQKKIALTEEVPLINIKKDKGLKKAEKKLSEMKQEPSFKEYRLKSMAKEQSSDLFYTATLKAEAVAPLQKTNTKIDHSATENTEKDAQQNMTQEDLLLQLRRVVAELLKIGKTMPLGQLFSAQEREDMFQQIIEYSKNFLSLNARDRADLAQLEQLLLHAEEKQASQALSSVAPFLPSSSDKAEERERQLGGAGFAMTAMLRNCLADMQEKAKKQEIDIHLQAEDILPKIHLEAQQFYSIICCLLKHALAFTPPRGKIIVSAHERAGRRLLLRVQHTGARVGEAALKAMLDNSSAMPQGGMDLGKVKKIIESKKGYFMLEAQESGGTMVSLLLPLALGNRPPSLEKNIDTPPDISYH